MKKYALILAALVAIVLVAVLASTKPSVKAPPQQISAQIRDPLSVPLLMHMAEEEGIHAGSQGDADLRIIKNGDTIEVTISEALQERLGAGSLESLGMVEPSETMSWNRFLNFLNELHELVVAASPHLHGGHDQNDHEGHNHDPEDEAHEEH